MSNLDLSIFKSDKERAAAAPALDQLEKSPGWALILKVLKLNQDYFSEQLNTKKDFSSLEEVYRLQDRIGDFDSMASLPAILKAEAQELPSDEEDPDVFPQPNPNAGN